MIKPGMYLSDRYEIIDKVGSGGMADVYKARDHKLNRFVAIKILKAEYNDDKTFVKKFRGEAQSAAGLSHPNIVNIYDVGEDDGMHYIIMELIEGITLKRFIERKGKLEIREAVGIGIQIAQGMEVAHANHIIHRDIKPQNIIISREGKVKVTDFGIAKATSSNTITSNAMGSVHYFSPEQARGGYCDEKSDIYSLGVTMYEMISGHVPFEGENAVSIALLHIQNEAKSLKDLDPTVPISVDKIVQKCMQKKPERRYLSVSELIADLKRSITEPDVDFVVIPDILKEKQPTVVLSKEEMESIRKASSVKNSNATSQEEDFLDDGFESEDYDDYDDYDDYEGDYDDYEDEYDKYDDYEEDDDNESENDIDDEEDEDSEDEQAKEKMALIVAISCAVVFAFVVIFAVLKLTGFIGTKPNSDAQVTNKPTATATVEVTDEPTQDEENSDVPSLVGKTKEEAQKYADEHGYTLRYEEVESAKPKGIVVDQEVEGDIIKVMISDGSGNIEMIDVTKKSQAEAKSALTEEGFTGEFVIEYVNSDDVEIGYVVETNPKAGDSVKIVELDKITLYISEGASTKIADVPYLLGKTVEEAKAMITAANLVLGSVSEAESDEYDEGQVCAQSKQSGLKISEGSTIDITISTGKPQPKTTTVPDLSGKTEDEAKKLLEDKDLKVGNVYKDYSDTVDEGLVIRQTVEANSEVELGTKVTFTLSMGPKEEPTPEPTPTPEPQPTSNKYTVSVNVFNYGENPFMDPALSTGDADADKVAGNINIKAIFNGTTVVYDGSVASSFEQFNSNGFTFSFNFESESECTSKDQLEFTYTFNNTNVDYSGASNISINRE